MSPPSKHIVAKGDTLSKIAKDHGFQNWAVVWNCDGNASLRALRIKPERIVPGDEVSIPQRVTKKARVTPGEPGKFRLVEAPHLAAFTLTVKDQVDGGPFGGLDVELQLPNAESSSYRTDEAGLIEIREEENTSGEVEVVSIQDRGSEPAISYRKYIPGPLELGTSHELIIPNKRKVADAVAASAGVVRRATWGAAPPKKELEQDWDYGTVVIHHSGDSGEKSPAGIQQKHFSKGYDDIAYEYVVTLEGAIYEGRHIAFKSAGNSEHNTGKIAIIIAGDFEHQWWDEDDDPTQNAVDAVVKLVSALKAHFPLTQLVGHRDLPRAKGDTECPGAELYKLLDEMRLKTGLTGP